MPVIAYAEIEFSASALLWLLTSIRLCALASASLVILGVGRISRIRIATAVVDGGGMLNAGVLVKWLCESSILSVPPFCRRLVVQLPGRLCPASSLVQLARTSLLASYPIGSDSGHYLSYLQFRDSALFEKCVDTCMVRNGNTSGSGWTHLAIKIAEGDPSCRDKNKDVWALLIIPDTETIRFFICGFSWRSLSSVLMAVHYTGSVSVPRRKSSLRTTLTQFLRMHCVNESFFVTGSTYQAKPEPNLSRVKRKALEPPTLDSDELCPFGLKKKPKEELSCALCHVSATGEKALNIHLQGKKHKRKEAALRNQKMRKNPINAPCPKKIGDPSEPKETNITASSDLEGKSLKQSGSQNGSDEIKEDAEDLKPENMLLMLKGQNARKLNKTGRSMMLRKANGSVGYKKIKKTKTANKFKFWCEMCRVGSFCSRVMEDHKKGKKHRGKLLGYEPSISEEATFKITQTSEAVPEKPEDPDVANQVNEKTTDDMSNTEAVPENPEDTDVANQANEKTINNMTKTEAVPEKPEDMDVANQANGEVTGDMANIEAVHGKPEDTDAAKQANEKITNDMTKTEAVPEKPEGTAVANQTNGKATDDMANEIQ
ncbi:hypothetical protein L484_004173 [Morus notabilis]|uniref:U1-type domain-containing protein n=1 Tax=Morus notabilis TaxID=981085 RepID=W9QLE8_9ROSA|nr:hypothetical protein L484_004173 [Morus notabilis]